MKSTILTIVLSLLVIGTIQAQYGQKVSQIDIYEETPQNAQYAGSEPYRININVTIYNTNGSIGTTKYRYTYKFSNEERRELFKEQLNIYKPSVTFTRDNLRRFFDTIYLNSNNNYYYSR